MARYPSGYKNQDQPKIGVLSGWGKITTNRGDDTLVDQDHGFTVLDLLRLVKTLQSEFDSKKISSIEETIEAHIARQDNPHHVDLPQLNTSVLQELYKLWIRLGNEGDEEDFLRVLFQYVRIADLDETREGVLRDHVVNALGLSTLIEDHDLNPNAHDALLTRLFPGTAVKYPPTYALDAYVGAKYGYEVSRNSKLWILNEKGSIEELPNNTIKPDYSTGVPAFAIFGTNKNLIGSEAYTNTSYWKTESASVSTSSTLYSLDDKQCTILTEAATSTAVLHALTYAGTNITQEQGTWYTVSCFVTPNGRSSVGIKITSSDDQYYQWAHFELESGKVFTERFATDIFGTCYSLANNWYRLQVTFKATKNGKLTFQIYPLDIYDGDAAYEGLGSRGIGLFGVVVTKSAYLTPYIPANTTIQPTVLKIPVTKWYNKTAGTMVVQANNVGVNAKLSASSTLFEIGSPTKLVMSASLPVGNDNKLFLSNYDNKNLMIAYKWMEASTQTWITAMQGFSGTQHVFGSTENDACYVTSTGTINPNAEYLYVGCNRLGNNQLNGFIKSISYYSALLEPDNIPFFTGRPSSEA